jgi:lysophospholipid acyltransferase (LPLAT)-like uncharacterized protein
MNPESPPDRAPPPPSPAGPAPIILRKRIQLAIAQRLAVALIRSLGATLRFRAVGEREVEALRGPEKRPVLIATFHGPHFPLLYFCRGRNACTITSRSNDGLMLTRILHSLGYQTVRGSSSRGGVGATIELTRKVQAGVDIAVAVDGPRGPAWCVKPGVLLVARLTGRPIVPVAGCPGVHWRFQSWDRFRLPMPFSSAWLVAGEPMWVPPDADDAELERLRIVLHRRMIALQLDTDRKARPWVLCLPQKRKAADRPTLERFAREHAAELGLAPP